MSIPVSSMQRDPELASFLKEEHYVRYSFLMRKPVRIHSSQIYRGGYLWVTGRALLCRR